MCLPCTAPRFFSRPLVSLSTRFPPSAYITVPWFLVRCHPLSQPSSFRLCVIATFIFKVFSSRYRVVFPVFPIYFSQREGKPSANRAYAGRVSRSLRNSSEGAANRRRIPRLMNAAAVASIRSKREQRRRDHRVFAANCEPIKSHSHLRFRLHNNNGE